MTDNDFTEHQVPESTGPVVPDTEANERIETELEVRLPTEVGERVDTEAEMVFNRDPDTPAKMLPLNHAQKVLDKEAIIGQIVEQIAEESEEIFEPVKNVNRRSSEQHTDVSHLLKVNMCYTSAYVSCYAFGVWYYAFALCGNTQTTTIFEAKLGWSE